MPVSAGYIDFVRLMDRCTLILTDSYSNIVRLIDIISALDVETVDTVLEIIQLRFASADTIANNLSQVVTQTPSRRRRWCAWPMPSESN